MTGLLASVMTPEEAEAAVAGGADIIDLKDPRRGALGALPLETIRACIAQVAGRRPVSATVGDLPMAPAIVDAAVERLAALGLDLVKIGIFPGGDLEACLDTLAQQARQGARLVAVLFADQEPDSALGSTQYPDSPSGVIAGLDPAIQQGRQQTLDARIKSGHDKEGIATRRHPGDGFAALIPRLAASGFAGVMLDTADKGCGGLRDHMAPERLAAFVAQAHDAGLIAGLAGSLRRDDIAALLPLAPDYLGFRGALTQTGRSSGLDPSAFATVRAAIPSVSDYQVSAASSATAAAGAERAAASLASAGPSISSAKSR